MKQSWGCVVELEWERDYTVTARQKKSCIEREVFVKGNQKIMIETCWRNATWIITPMSTEEIAMIEDSMDDCDDFYPYEFEEHELVEFYDGVSTDFHFDNVTEDTDTIEDIFWEHGRMGLEDEGWEEQDGEFFIMGGIDVVEGKNYG